MTRRAKPELLAPAGGMEQLHYAIHFGADAVYLAGENFGLRRRASNFTAETLPEAVAFAHDHDVKVHLTCNAFPDDESLRDLPDFIRMAAAAGVDAIIVSDLGVLSEVRRFAPDVEVHVSTQANVGNSAAARMWYELGARRIVCAREMSVADIARMREAIPEDLQLEVFVHGAMCMALSGRCLISDYMTGRRANDGHCTQPCRWKYALQEETREGRFYPIEQDEDGSYLMNAEDMNMLAHLDDLVAAGVDSFKIEGRVKKAFYVATVVNAYRHVIDGDPSRDWLPELETISHRPYSTGFFYGTAEQSSVADRYVQRYDWVAEVRDCLPDGDGFVVTVACRNRFYEGDTLELLSPGRPIERIVVRELFDIGNPADAVPVDTANKAMGAYCFRSSISLSDGDILRVERKDVTRKN